MRKEKQKIIIQHAETGSRVDKSTVKSMCHCDSDPVGKKKRGGAGNKQEHH
jgi:hypothetical protein